MITINGLRQYITEVKHKIEAINFTTLLVDDSQFSKVMEERKSADNIMMICVIPSHNLQGPEDNTKTINQMLFFFAKKLSNKDTTHNMFLDAMNECQETAKEFVDLLLLEKSEEGTLCGIFSDVMESSIAIEPFWNKAQSHGYLVEFDIRTT